MITKYSMVEGKLQEADGSSSLLWIFTHPQDSEKQMLISDFKIDEHTLASALDPDESSRIEFEADHAAVIFKYPKNYSAKDQFLFRIGSVGFFLFKERLIIVMSDEIPVLSGKPFNSATASVNELMLKFMFRLIRRYLEHLRVINMISEEIETKINISMENRYLLNLFSLEKSLVYYLNAINSNGFTLEKMKNSSAKLGFAEGEMEFLEDIMVENHQSYKQAEIYSNILANLMDARVSIVSNNLNILMKTLNIITITIMVPTLVVSAFSMNVAIPLQKHPFAFWMILGLAAVSAVTFMIWWVKRKLH